MKISKLLMDNGADPMIPNNDNKETAFHYCGKSGNSEVAESLIPGKFNNVNWYLFAQVVKEIIKHLHAGQIQLVVNKQSG